MPVTKFIPDNRFLNSTEPTVERKSTSFRQRALLSKNKKSKPTRKNIVFSKKTTKRNKLNKLRPTTVGKRVNKVNIVKTAVPKINFHSLPTPAKLGSDSTETEEDFNRRYDRYESNLASAENPEGSYSQEPQRMENELISVTESQSRAEVDDSNPSLVEPVDRSKQNSKHSLRKPMETVRKWNDR